MGAGSSTEQRSPEQPAGSDTPSELELSGHGPAAEASGAAGDPADADPATKVSCGHLPGWGGMEMGRPGGFRLPQLPAGAAHLQTRAQPFAVSGVFCTGARLASLWRVSKGGDLASPSAAIKSAPACRFYSFFFLPVGWQTGVMAGGASVRIDRGQAS